MVTDENDKRKAINAEIALRFVKDTSRLIDNMGPEISRLMEPIKQRHQINHFMEEYEDLFRRTRGSQ